MTRSAAMVAWLVLMWVSVGLLNLAAVLGARKATARVLRIPAVHWLPWRSARTEARISVIKQATFVLAGAVTCYGCAGALFSLSLKLDGKAPGPGEATTIIDVLPGSPAAAAGLQDGDRIVELAGTPIGQWADLPPAVRAHAGQRVEVKVQRASERLRMAVVISPAGQLGVQAQLERQPVGVGEALHHGMARPIRVLAGTAQGLYRLLAGSIEADLGGPVMIVRAAGRPSFARSYLTLFGMQNTTYGLPFGLVLAFLTRVKRAPKPRESQAAG